MTTATTDIMRRHVQAITSMLLLDRHLEPGVAIMAGTPLETDGDVWLGQVAARTCIDVVHLELAIREDGVFGLMGINVVVARASTCWFQTGCRLWLPNGGNRALILPQPQSRGHFRLSTRELIHIDGKPADLEGGMRRADQRLRDLVACGAMNPGQVELTELPIAA